MLIWLGAEDIQKNFDLDTVFLLHIKVQIGMKTLLYEAIRGSGSFYPFIPPPLGDGPGLHLGVAFQLVRSGEGRGEGEPFPLECTTQKIHASPAHIPLTRMFLKGGEDGGCSLIK